jgi:hypothetical protein
MSRPAEGSAIAGSRSSRRTPRRNRRKRRACLRPQGHSKATRAYAWSSPVEGSDKRRFLAVLHMGAIKSPADAVRAAIVAEHRHGQTRWLHVLPLHSMPKVF